jgi:hypothetical protein
MFDTDKFDPKTTYTVQFCKIYTNVGILFSRS